MVSLSSFMSQAKSSVLDCPWFFGCFSVYWLRALYKFPFPPFFIASQQVHYVKKPVLRMVSWKKRYFAFNLLCIGHSLKQLSSIRLISQFAYTVCSNLCRLVSVVAGWFFFYHFQLTSETRLHLSCHKWQLSSLLSVLMIV
jgi:hypothetical protein